MNKDSEAFNKIVFYIGKAVVIAAGYYVASLLGGLFVLNGSGGPLLWPQAGFALAFTLLLGYSALPGIFLGSFFTAFATGVPFTFTFIYSLGNTIAILIPSYFIFQQKNFSKYFDNYRSVCILIFFGVILQPFFSSIISAFGLYFLNLSPIELIPSIIGKRYLRDALGILVFTPFLIVWFGNPLPNLKDKRNIEVLLIFSITIAIMAYIFFGIMPKDFAHSISFLVIPLIIWASIRVRIHGLQLINLLASIIFLWGISQGQGCLFTGDVSQYQTYIWVVCTMLITSLIISASMAKLRASQSSLSYLSTHDSLTGLYNRLFFETEFSRLEKSRQFPISIIMVDVDGLKKVNDNFGHQTGDQVLKHVAELFLEVFRQEDVVSRLGGDEFVILLPDSDASITKKIVKRIKKQIAKYNHRHTDLPISVSLGVSTANQGESLKGHLKNADSLMYEEKQKKKRHSS